MFRKSSLLTFIAAVTLIAAAVPAPVAGQVEASAVAGYGFRSQNSSRPATSGPLVRFGVLLRVIGPIALGGEIENYWLGEVRRYDYQVERDRILTYAFCIEVGKLRSRISPRVTLGFGGGSVSTNSVVTLTTGDTETYTSSSTVIAPHVGLVMVRKPAAATLALRAEVRAALIYHGPDEAGDLLTSLSLGVAF